MKVFGSLRELVAAIFRKDSQEITLRPNQTTNLYSGPRDVQLPQQDSDAVLVSRNSVDELSNKTLNAAKLAGNTLLQNAAGVGASQPSIRFSEDPDNGTNYIQIQAPATLTSDHTLTLPTPPLAGANDSVVTLNSAGVLSTQKFESALGPLSIVQRDTNGDFDARIITASLSGNATNVTGIVAKANGGTGADNSSVTFPSTGTIVTRDATETLLNKTTISSTALATGALTLPAGTAGQQPGQVGQGTAVPGMIRFNSSSTSFEGYDGTGWSGIGGGGTTDRVTQASHGFVVGDVLYMNGSTYTKAIATSAATAEVVGVVSRVLDTSTFEVTLSGEVSGLSGLTVGEVYFLSDSVAGGITATEPSTIGYVSLPLGVASSTTSLYVAPKRGAVVGGTNARTRIELTNNGSKVIYTNPNPSTLLAGEITGWVNIDATTDLRFYLSAQFARKGDGTDWNISYQTTGDTPPSGFSVSINSSGVVSIALPSLAGYVSSYVDYALNGPAVGASAFPLNIDSTNVNIVASAPLTLRNKVINGAFDVWQRNTSISDPSGNGFSADRWQISFNGTGATRTISRQNFALGQTEVPGNPKYFLKFLQSVAGSGGSFNQLFQRIEGVETLSGQTVTLSFYAKAAAAGSTIDARARQHFGTGGSPSADVVTLGGIATLTTGWQRFQFTFALPSILGKVLGTSNTDRLQIELLCPFNTTFDIDIADVQLEAGPAATPFERKTYGDELRACQRYYYRLTSVGSGYNFVKYGTGFSSSATTFKVSVQLPTTMRISPSSIDTAAASNFAIFDGVSNYAASAIALDQSVFQNVSLDITAAGMTQYRSGYLQANNNQTAYIGFSAEL